ncbi:hypothetical protein LUZ60_012892 [Juncus effusus]|nr:hypothetical protein LUZ60_012892 [Juncus effusus]
MDKANKKGSLLTGFLSLIFLFFNLGYCFVPCHSQQAHNNQKSSGNKRKKISPSLSPSPLSSTTSTFGLNTHQTSLSLTSIRSYVTNFFSCYKNNSKEDQTSQTAPASTLFSPSPLRVVPSSPYDERTTSYTAAAMTNYRLASNIMIDAKKHSSSFTSRTEIFPCSLCGEVFSKTHLLDLHQAMKHSLSELSDSDSGMNIVRIIFQSGWRGISGGPSVRRVFKIQHNQRNLARFEEYRDMVRSRAARRYSGGITSGMEERCMADGNERLRFYCCTMMCTLGAGGVCGSPYCCTCSILRHGFSGKQADLTGITTYSSSWGAHASLSEEVEREFAFLQVRRAMLVCRVVAGRVAHGGAEEMLDVRGGIEKGAMFDSIVAPMGQGCDEELVVFNPKAVLPCFVITYAA